jgi:oligosaccharide repeat unit polymerase
MLQDFLFITCWAILPFVFYYLLKIAGLSLRKPTFPSFTILLFFVFQYIGLPFLYFKIFMYTEIPGIDYKFLIIKVALYTSLSMLLMIFGFILAKQHFGRLEWSVAGQGMLQDVKYESNKRFLFALIVLIVLCTSVLLFFLFQIGFERVPLLKVFSSSSSSGVSVYNARDEMYSLINKPHRYYVFTQTLLSFATLSLFAKYLKNKNKKSLILFLFGFFLSSVSLLSATLKGPYANFLVALFLVYIFIYYNGKIPIKAVIKFSLIMTIILMIFFYLFMGIDSVINMFFSVIRRLFTGQLAPACYYLEYFNNHNYLFGSTFPNPMGILPFEHVPLSREIIIWAIPESIGRVSASMPAAYWVEMYANFGVIGILLSSILIGYGLYWFNKVILRFRHTSLMITFYVWLLIRFKRLSETFGSNFLFDIHLIAIILTFMIISFFIGRGVIGLYPKKIKI